MSSIECTFDEFKKIAREFQVAVPTLNADELEGAWKCMGLAYLGMKEPMWQESAAIVLGMGARARLQREVELERSERAGGSLMSADGHAVSHRLDH